MKFTIPDWLFKRLFDRGDLADLQARAALTGTARKTTSSSWLGGLIGVEVTKEFTPSKETR